MDLPQEFLNRMEALLREEFPFFLDSYERPRHSGLRVNTLKISTEEFMRIAPFHLTPIPWTDNGFFYEKEDAPSRHPFYYAGLYYLQEPSAMTPAQVLPVTPGEHVLDLCAAPGGKATELASKLQGKGLLVANDISASRAKALLKNLEVFGVTNSFVTNTTSSKLAAQFPGAFDKILVDAPCSGEGMFRKDIANARAWSLSKVKECARTQKEIVLQAVSMLRPGGMMLYSTCTFSPEENEQVIAYLLENCPEMELLPIPMADGFCNGRPELANDSWKDAADQLQSESGNKRTSGYNTADLARCVRIFPHRVSGEGHFLALLRKRMPDEYMEENIQTKFADYESIFRNNSNNLTNQKSPQARKRKKKSRQTQTAISSSASSTAPVTKAERETVLSFLQNMFQFESAPEKGTDSLNNIELHGSQAYYVQETPGINKGIPFLRNGLYLGEVKKDRFEPSQALAMAVSTKSCTAVLDFDSQDERVRRYLCGETVEVDDMLSKAKEAKEAKEASQKGNWQLICVNGYPLGWGKLLNGTLKNKYHPGWRMRQM
ncbi:MAG: RsmB/NOP family class I SAM-dependent RNA methyltransferase [Clostridiales bacterium]|nr:RsmB/NOP family class I SAM-dependent RNA methyltransferase [Clostridiales bacterium]